MSAEREESGPAPAYGTTEAGRPEPQSTRFEVENAIGGRTLQTSEGPRTYLWRRDGVGSCTLIAEAPPDVTVRYSCLSPPRVYNGGICRSRRKGESI